MKWEKVRLGDVAKVSSSKRIFASQYTKSGVPFYRQKEIIDKKNKNEIINPLFISWETFDDIKKKFGAPNKNDLLITAVGATLGIPYVVIDEIFYFKDGNLIWLSNFDESINSKYLYYWINSDIGQKTIWSRTIGSAQPALTIDILKQLEIPVPIFNTQCKIVKILSAYDDLIESNQKQINLLEEAAQRLYKEWFVDFRFPGYENAKFIDGIPEGWRKEPICNIVSYEIGGGWGEDYLKEQNDKPAFVIRGTDLHGITHGDILSIPYRYHTQSNLASRILQDGDIVFEVSGGSKTEGVARTLLIRKELLEIYGSPVMCASFCKLIRFVDNSLSQYMYNTLQYLRLSGKTSEFDKKSASSIVNYRWKDFLSQQDVLIPTLTIIEAYNRLAECYYYEIINQSKMIECLKNARDRLLPKLMSGEIEV